MIELIKMIKETTDLAKLNKIREILIATTMNCNYADERPFYDRIEESNGYRGYRANVITKDTLMKKKRYHQKSNSSHDRQRSKNI